MKKKLINFFLKSRKVYYFNKKNKINLNTSCIRFRGFDYKDLPNYQCR